MDSWGAVAAEFGARKSPKQLRERYLNPLDPAIVRGPFSAAEDAQLVRGVRHWGTRWTAVAAHFEGRTELSIKNRYYACLVRRLPPGVFDAQKTTMEDVVEAVNQLRSRTCLSCVCAS